MGWHMTPGEDRLPEEKRIISVRYMTGEEIINSDAFYLSDAIYNILKNSVEAVAEKKLLHMLPQELQSVYAPILTPDDAEIEKLVKAADKLSAYIKCVEELKAGNTEFREAAAQTRRALEGYGVPEVSYFLDTFMDSFSMTLDELK